MPDLFSSLLCAAATLASFKAFKVAYRCYPYFRLPQFPSKQKWMIISGSTGGIGKEFAKQMLRENIPLILIGRSDSKLEALYQQLRQIQPGFVLKLSINFQDQSINRKQVLEKFNKLNLGEKSVSGYVNCIGIACNDRFVDMTEEDIQAIKRVNIKSLEYFLPMIHSHPAFIPHPFVINFSSQSAHWPLKYSAVYSASKAYLSNLLKGFAKQNPNITTLSVEPWFVKTKMIGFKNYPTAVLPEQIIKNCFKLLGRKQNGTGCLKHQLIAQFQYFYDSALNIQIEESHNRKMKLEELKKRKKNP